MGAEAELILELITPELILSGGGIALDLGGDKETPRARRISMNDKRTIDPELLRIMCCPKCHGDLLLTEDGKGLDCANCGIRYPIEEGIPVMLVDRATPVERQ